MKNTIITLIASLFLSCVMITGQPTKGKGVGSVWASEKKTWIDDSTGYEINQWTSSGKNSHPYFTNESFIDENTAIIFSDRAGKRQMFKLNLVSGELIQMTDVKKIRNMDHLPKFKTVWYLDSTTLMEINTETLVSKEVFKFDTLTDVNSFSVTCDAKYFVFASDLSLGKSGTCGYGPFAISKLDLKTKQITKIIPGYGFNISHLQTNPVDPNLILYCWQWEALGRPRLVGATPIRIWWVNIDGTEGGPLTQQFGLHRTHEAWSPDGKYITYSGDFRFGPNKGKEVLGFESIDGTTNKYYDASVWHAHQNIFKDNKHYIADLYNHDERYLMMFVLDEKTDKLNPVKLFKHASTWSGQSSHPHPRISPNGRWVLFTTDRTGTAQVYSVRINLDKEIK